MLHIKRASKVQRTPRNRMRDPVYMDYFESFQTSMFVLSAFLVAFIVLQGISSTALLIPIETYTPTDTKNPISIYYGNSSPLVFSANITGVYTHQLPSLKKGRISYHGDPKAVTILYGKESDSIAALPVEDSLLTIINLKSGRTSHLKLWGDYSAICTVGSSFVYIFGKGTVKQVLVDNGKITEIGNFAVPVEAEACAVTAAGSVFFGGNDGIIYTFAGNTIVPSSSIQKTSIQVDGEVAGMTTYASSNTNYLLVSVQSGTVEVFSTPDHKHQSSFTFSEEDAELEGIAVYQNPLSGYQSGAFLVSFDEDPGRKGLGIIPLSQLGLPINTSFNPSNSIRNPDPSSKCSNNGFRTQSDKCLCFAGYAGARCAQRTCPKNCSSRGTCESNNICKCKTGWTGPDCSFKIVPANGGDGDDPAIWIHPTNRASSRVVTTTKSDAGAGFALFDLSGKIISQLPAGEPNNVDIIYNFSLSDGRVVDLAVAGCRDKNTICIAEVTETGLSSLVNLPVKSKFKVYGSCVYHSPISGKHYIFINSKTAAYLQYEISPTLEATLVREFVGGNGGQVEGCVVDDQNSNVFIGEEPYGLWRYSAEPDGGNDHVLVDSIEGNFFPDVEGVSLVYGKTKDQGLLIVSCQGVSAYNVYRRGGNHEFVGRFTISAGKVDKVTNTDGVAAVGTDLGPGFERGVVVVHDDVNSRPDGSRETGASFKIVPLGDILTEFGLPDEADTEWDPRS